MNKKLVKIGEAAKMLNVSIDTLRRLDKKGALKAIRLTPTGHRYYDINDIKLLVNSLFEMGKKWVTSEHPEEPDRTFYCPDSAIFQAKLHKLEAQLHDIEGLQEEFSLVTSVIGEIGNNSFDHNLGSWMDVRGILFAYDLKKRQIVLADRGQGVLATLRRVRPSLADDLEALRVAFTEKITGRAPEWRGNGLKYVRAVVTSTHKKIHTRLVFQTGNAYLQLENGDTAVEVTVSDVKFRGCLAFIEF